MHQLHRDPVYVLSSISARKCGVPPQFLLNLVQETATALQERIGPEREALEARYGAYPALQRIQKIVTQQCRMTTGE